MLFPADAAKGGRPTTDASKRIVGAALRGCGGEEAERAAARAERDKGWKFNYPRHYLAMVQHGAGSREAARAVHDAMPLLQRAESVTVLTADSAGADAMPRMRTPGIERFGEAHEGREG